MGSSGLVAYAASKLYLIMASLDLNRRLRGTGVDLFPVHPGAWGGGLGGVRHGWTALGEGVCDLMVAALRWRAEVELKQQAAGKQTPLPSFSPSGLLLPRHRVQPRRGQVRQALPGQRHRLHQRATARPERAARSAGAPVRSLGAATAGWAGEGAGVEPGFGGRVLVHALTGTAPPYHSATPRHQRYWHVAQVLAARIPCCEHGRGSTEPRARAQPPLLLRPCPVPPYGAWEAGRAPGAGLRTWPSVRRVVYGHTTRRLRPGL